MSASAMRSMHRSRLRAVLIDVPGETFTEEAGFWAGALGRSLSRPRRRHVRVPVLSGTGVVLGWSWYAVALPPLDATAA